MLILFDQHKTKTINRKDRIMTEFGFVILGVMGGAVLLGVGLVLYVYFGRKKQGDIDY